MKITSAILVALPLACSTLIASLHADAAAKPTEEVSTSKNSLKVRGAAFFPQGSVIRDIYGTVWPEGSIEYSYLFCKHWAAFVNGAVTHESGHSIGQHQKTRMTLVPATIGVNAKFGCSSWFHPYLGVGVGAAYANFYNDSDFLTKHVHKWGFASFYQGGLEFDIKKWFFIDLFAAYRFNWFGFNSDQSNRQTGGADLGAGLGFRF
jgi:outer membrane protein W